jgi:hypothetical protein
MPGSRDRLVYMNAFAGIGGWGFRRCAVAVAAGFVWLLAAGVPTDLIDTPLFVRMTPPEWWNYPLWLASALLVGLLAATYVAPSGGGAASGSQGKMVGGGVLSVFAVGCPVCNKLVVLALGMSGATAYFAPVQPLLGLLSVGLLGYALRVRLSRESSCPVEVPPAESTERHS